MRPLGVGLGEVSKERALGVSDRACILDHGAVVYHANARTLCADQAIQDRYGSA